LREHLLSEQDSPTAQSANNSSSCFQNVFGDEIGSFYWWGMLKDKLYIVNICMEGDLKESIQGVVFSVSPAEYQCVFSVREMHICKLTKTFSSTFTYGM